MARSYDASKAEQVRKHYLESQFVAVDLRPPVLVDGIPGDADGLMPHDKTSAPLEIEIPLFSDRHSVVPNLLTVEWLPASSSEYLFVFDEDVPGSATLPDDRFPLRRQLPLSLFQNYEGKFEFRYRVRNWNDHTIERESPPAPVTIDRIGPIHPGTPEAIEGVPALVTSDILTRDGGVKCQIPDFAEDKKEFVRVMVGLMDKPPESAAEFPALVVIDELLDPGRQILIPENFVTAIGSKLQYLVYYLFDKAGNRSERSYDRSIQVALGELPSGLSPCEVPLADDDGFIDRADGAMPVKVHIPEYTDWQTSDGIVIEFGNQTLARTSVGAHLDFPLKITIPWGRVSAAYDFLAGGPQEVQVDYRVFRGDYPTRSPAPTPATLILELPGPENPNPEPINPVLDVIRFLSSEGSDRELTIDDIDDDATAFFKLPDNVVANDVFTITYNNRVISSAPYTVSGSEDPNQEVSLSIPWDDIKLTPVMTGLEMFYTFTRPGFVNPQESKRTAIDVLVEVVGGRYDDNLDTLDYYTLKLELHDTLIQLKTIEFESAKSIVQWESRQFEEGVCSFAGYALAGSNALNFDPLLYARMPDPPAPGEGEVDKRIRPEKVLKPGYSCPEGMLLISLHRCQYWNFDLGCEPDYTSGLKLRFHDIDGNRHAVKINFKSNTDRNELVAQKDS